MKGWCYSLGLVDVSVAGGLQHAWLNEEERVRNNSRRHQGLRKSKTEML